MGRQRRSHGRRAARPSHGSCRHRGPDTGRGLGTAAPPRPRRRGGPGLRGQPAGLRRLTTCFSPADTTATVIQTDLLRDGTRTLPRAGAAPDAAAGHQLWYGAVQAALETEYLLSTASSFQPDSLALEAVSFDMAQPLTVVYATSTVLPSAAGPELAGHPRIGWLRGRAGLFLYIGIDLVAGRPGRHNALNPGTPSRRLQLLGQAPEPAVSSPAQAGLAARRQRQGRPGVHRVPEHAGALQGGRDRAGGEPGRSGHVPTERRHRCPRLGQVQRRLNRPTQVPSGEYGER